MPYYQRHGLLFRVALALLRSRCFAAGYFCGKTRIRPHRCAILQFMQSMGERESKGETRGAIKNTKELAIKDKKELTIKDKTSEATK